MTATGQVWSSVLQRYLYSRIVPLVSPPDTEGEAWQLDLVSDKVFDLWVRAFTHPSYDPNSDRNYRIPALRGGHLVEFYVSEVAQEFMDDEMMRTLFISAEWKREKRRIATALGLGQHLRTVFELKDVVYEELIDALFSAIYDAGQRLISYGDLYGDLLARRAFRSLYSDYLERLKSEKTAGQTATVRNARQELVRLHEGLGWSGSRVFDPLELGKPKAVKKRGEIVSFEVRFEMTPQAVEWLQSRGNVVQSTLLAVGRGIDRDSAIQDAIEKSLVTLEDRYGVNSDTVVQEEQNALPAPVRERLTADGIVAVETIADVDSRSNASRYELVGVNKEGRRIVLVALLDRSNSNRQTVQQTMLQLYADRGEQRELYVLTA